MSKLVRPSIPRVVVHQQRSGNFLTAPSTVQQHQGVGPPRHPRRRRAIAHQRGELAAIFFGEESTTNHPPSRIGQTEKHKEFLPSLR
jgi:hypothetical protein